MLLRETKDIRKQQEKYKASKILISYGVRFISFLIHCRTAVSSQTGFMVPKRDQKVETDNDQKSKD